MWIDLAVLVSEPIKAGLGNADHIAATRRLVPLVTDYAVILPSGIEL